METVVALALLASLILAGWLAYRHTGERRWSVERDPLGEPPVRTAAAVAALVVVVGLLSTGGSGAVHPGSTQLGLDDDAATLSAAEADDDPFGVGPAPASANVVAAASGQNADGESAGTTPSPSGRASQPAAAAAARWADLVDRAHDASERRGATITWYAAIVRKAERASARRSR